MLCERVASLIRREAKNTPKEMTTRKLARTAYCKTTAHRLYRFLRPPRLKSNRIYRSRFTAAVEPGGCRENEFTRSQKPEMEFRAELDGGDRSSQGRYGEGPRTSQTLGGKVEEAAVIATCHLSRAPRAAESGSA